MPAVIARQLGGGPNTLGMLMAATGVGALASAIYLAGRRTVVGLGRVIMIGALTRGVSLIAFSMATNVWVAGIALVLVGGSFIVQLASANTVIQTIVDEQFRGRVMAFYTMAFFGTSPIGSLLGGFAADWFGAPRTILVGGVICLGAGVWFAWRLPHVRQLVRPIYVARGIIPAPPAVDTGA
jgi:MFS family permease